MYYKNASKILCVSKTLINSIPSEYKDKVIYLPNGVDLDLYQSSNYLMKDKDTIYISLIGISVSESLFYLNIFPKIKQKIGDVKLLLVGGGPRFPLIQNYIKNKKNKSDYILTGYIPYKQIREYFYLSDVGLYPTLQNRYYDAACPLKVMEYSAVSKPVVSTDLEELKILNFPNVFLAKPNAQDFVDKIEKALNYNGPYPSLEEYTWKFLSRKLDKALKKL